MNICVVGTGYVGLVTGAVFADLGNDVVCVDKDRDKSVALKAGRMPIYEPGLEEMVLRNAGDSRLSFTSDLGVGIRHADVIFIAVGTPPKDTGETDLSHVESVAAEIGYSMDRYKVVVNKSTVPVGTGGFVREVIARHQLRPIEFDVVSNPEFLREGSAIEDTLRPDRIVIGAPTQQVAMTLVELYAPLERPMIITDLPSAEVIKYASNAFLAAKISFIHTAGRLGYDFKLLRSVVEINRERAAHLVETMAKALGSLDDTTIAVLGLAFKPNTDDMREAKSLEVIHLLHAAGARVRAYDPAAMDNARAILPPFVTFAGSPYEAAEGAHAAVLVTEWNEFRFLNLERLRAQLKRPVIFDGRNLWEPERMRRLGFEYHSVGRKPVLPV